MNLLPRPLPSEEYFEGVCHLASLLPPASRAAAAALLTLLGLRLHHASQRQSPEATGHFGRSREKNLCHLFPPGSKSRLLLLPVLKNSLERFASALPASVCSPSAPTKEVRHEKKLFNLARCAKMYVQSCSSKYVYNGEKPKAIIRSTNGEMWYG